MKRTKCRYCGAKLDENGYCTRPCNYGRLLKILKRPQT